MGERMQAKAGAALRGLGMAGLLLLAACDGAAPSGNDAAELPIGNDQIAVTVVTADGPKRFRVETARTAAEQAQGMKYQTAIGEDGGMLFHPYPPDGSGPAPASFWMKDTAMPLDLIFIRGDGTIARIAENAVPYAEDRIESGEPVAAVLELKGGKAAENMIAPGDRVEFEGGPGSQARR